MTTFYFIWIMTILFGYLIVMDIKLYQQKHEFKEIFWRTFAFVVFVLPPVCQLYMIARGK